MTVLNSLADGLGLGRGTVGILLGVAGLLLLGTVKRGVWLLRSGADADDLRRWRSVITWWILFVVMSSVLALGRSAVGLVMVLLSLLLLGEGLRLAETDRAYPYFAVGTVALYVWAWLDWSSLFLRALPLVAVVWLGIEIRGRVRAGSRLDRRRATGRAALLAVVGPAFVVGIASLPAPAGLPDAEMGWLVLLAVLTELNDSAQSWWGRNFGARRMAPRISPNKTWEGLVGGVATTVLAAILLAPLVTSYGRTAATAGAFGDGRGVPPWLASATVGLLVGLAGTAGDLSASILKRRAGVKDSGALLPGHGGLLDRFDSLALSAPVYFFVTWLVWRPGG